MKKTIVWILILLSIAALVIRFSNKAAEIFLGVKPRSGISILSIPDEATVYIDGHEVGKTPYENKDLEVKEYQIRIEKEQSIWEGSVKLTAGTLTVVNRDLSKEITSSSGEVLTLIKGKGLTVVSNPSDAEVEIDGKPYGKTPSTFEINPGGHTILISHPNYLKRSIRADLPDGFNLTISVDLALSEVDLTTISTPVIKTTPAVIVKNTPVGFLRVRERPSTASKEIAQVKPGDTLILLEELSGWVKVRLSDGKEGYVSSSYVEKKVNQ